MFVKPEDPRTYPDDYDPPKKYALVISCVDVRLLDDLLHFLNHDNLTNRYYHVALAGASLGVSLSLPGGQHVTPPKAVKFASWRDMLEDHIRVVLQLTEKKLYDIYIVEHRDCGAYAAFLDVEFADTALAHEKEKALHQHHAGRLRQWILKQFEGYLAEGAATRLPRIHCFLMDLRGDVEKIDEAEPQAKPRKKRKKG